MPATTATPPAPLFSPGFAVNPEPTLAWLRRHEPLHRLAPGVVVVTRYDDCRTALTAPGLSAAGGQAERQQRSGAATSMLNTDGAEHHRLRRPGQQLLGPRGLAEVTPGLEAVIDSVLDGLDPHEAHDLATAVSEPIATQALIHVLGLEDGPDTDRLPTLFAGAAVALDPMPSPEVAASGSRAVSELESWLVRHLHGSPHGRLGRLAADDVAQADILGIANLAVVGGWSPMAELLTTALELALYDPDHRTEAVGPNASSWCEDVIRWHTPIPFVARRAEQSVQLPSGEVPAGTQIIVHIGSSGRDTHQFDDSTAVVPQRSRPRQHLALGGGAHFCLGAPVVRSVLPIALTAFFRTFPAAHTRGSLFTWKPGVFPRRPLSTRVHLR